MKFSNLLALFLVLNNKTNFCLKVIILHFRFFFFWNSQYLEYMPSFSILALFMIISSQDMSRSKVHSTFRSEQEIQLLAGFTHS